MGVIKKKFAEVAKSVFPVTLIVLMLQFTLTSLAGFLRGALMLVGGSNL